MKNIKYFVGAVCLALSLNSCSDFLNEEPVSEIPAGDMWQTARDAKAGINEIYGLLRSTLRENYFYWGEFRSDNVAPGAPVMADQARVINNLMSTDEKCAKWTTLYQMINQANLAIKYVPNISMPDVADRNDYLGQAYALRALAYFYAIRVWGDVPLFTEPTEKYSEAIYKERTDKNYIADQTIDKMATIASKKGGRFVDFEPNIATWHTMFTEELTNKPSDDTPENDEYNSREFIFLVHFNMDEVGTNGYSYMYQWFSGSGNRAGVISDKFMSIFDEKDMKGDLRKDYTVKNYQNGNELRKYMAGDISNSLNKTCEVAYPIYRYTDMMLLQAEARAHQGKWGEALDLVKTVRDRAGLNTLTENDFASEEEVVNYILRERQVELAGEGRRWFDLLRTGKWKEVMKPINGMGQDGNELFPIHYSHILENPKIVQNTYYGNTNN